MGWMWLYVCFIFVFTVVICRRSDYVALMTSIQAAQDRARPMSDRYQTLITTDPTLSVSQPLSLPPVRLGFFAK